jgi:perosamine synthetase
MIPIYKPYLPSGSLKYAHEALDSTWLSSQGKYLPMVQEKLQELLATKYVLPLNNGTSACHLVAKCLSKLREKAYVIVPDNVYVAAWNAFLFDGSFDLITVKTELLTWNYDMNELDQVITDRPDAAVLVVHNVGNIINVPELQRKYPTTLFVEDNCEGFLGTYEDIYSGTASYTSAISFFGNKNITSGEGGAFITNDEEAYLFAKCVQGQGQSDKRFIHNELGYNYRMTNIQAAILYGQLEILPQIMEMKEEIFYDYRLALENRDDILYQAIDPNTKHSNWMFGIRVLGNPNYERAEAYFKQVGIEIRPMFYPIDTHQHLNNNYTVHIGNTTNARLLNQECFILPSYPELTVGEQAYILDTLNHYVKSIAI